MTAVAITILGPLAAAAAILLLRRGASALALLGAGAGLFGAFLALAGVAGGARYATTLPGLPGLPLRLVAVPLGAALAAAVAVVGVLILVYSVGYVGDREYRTRFFAGMSFFIAAMQTLVLAGDWVLLLAAWELIGLSSYLLIGLRFERAETGAAASRAFLYTRTADLGLYVAIFVLVASTGTSEISATLDMGGAAAVIAGLLLLVAAAGKSAQTPLHGWLQDAMVGPTPVSALLHSATLVSAGAILLIRTSPLLPQQVLLVAGLLGGTTVLVTGLIALASSDLKRLLAASTSSQYGFMLLAVGVGSPVAALVHLIAHAAMKSALFLGAGIFQHARGSTAFADLEGAGRERRRTFLGFAVAGLALAGVPPLSGFFSKDAILAATFESTYAPVLAPLALAGTLLTAAYVARVLRILGRGATTGEAVRGAGWMGAGLAGLVTLAAALGLAMKPLAALVGGELPEDLLGASFGLALALVGLVLGWLVPADRLLGPIRAAAGKGFRVAGGFDRLVAHPALALARACDAVDLAVYARVLAVGRLGLAIAGAYEGFERSLYAGVLGVGKLGLAVARATRTGDERGIDGLIFALVRGTRDLGRRARELQTGLVHRELLVAVAGGALILALLVAGTVGV